MCPEVTVRVLTPGLSATWLLVLERRGWAEGQSAPQIAFRGEEWFIRLCSGQGLNQTTFLWLGVSLSQSSQPATEQSKADQIRPDGQPASSATETLTTKQMEFPYAAPNTHQWARSQLNWGGLDIPSTQQQKDVVNLSPPLVNSCPSGVFNTTVSS